MGLAVLRGRVRFSWGYIFIKGDPNMQKGASSLWKLPILPNNQQASHWDVGPKA